ncbi:MAG: valine--tRNA ligase [Bacteroidales bacterium]|nr:MAG: valine--tRNA ligase [Bacteroidales bacterium]
MDIPSKYDPSKTEEKWYQTWIDHGIFRSSPDEREPYTIVIPPPNVTGVLHMGHMLNNTIQDILVRKARMQGKNTLWVPGTDHASIATEARVVAHLKESGIEKSDLSREEFLTHAWGWRKKHGGIILEQLKKLGASCDWDRTKFTMDDDMSESVIRVFVDLYRKGHIYRGVRMVNWDPSAQTAVSDEEVVHKEVESKLYYIKYKIEKEDSWLTIATTRPETILGDTAVCVHPEDDRYRHLQGKRILIPLLNRSVPIITDEYVDREFGTGALKITPAHDENDYEIGLKYDLDVIDIFNDDGTLSEKAGLFIGEDRFAARDMVMQKLEEQGHIVRIEDYVNKVGFSERTDAVIEPKLSLQWFLRMEELAKPALQNVLNDRVKLHPPKFKNIYRHWMENVRDWCISRQLWWGHRIPAYYLPTGTILPTGENVIVAETVEEALTVARRETGNSSLPISDLKQDEDVLDTWFSSWLWPITVFDGIRYPENPDITYYYPTNDLVTAPEILFFWVARMIIAGYEYMGEKPFQNVYLTGIVRDRLGRKMSKSLGNSPEPLELIRKYGADGVRVGMLLCSPAGNDLLFEENLTEQGRNFGNKIWNAFRLIKNWHCDDELVQPRYAALAVEWFEGKLYQAIEIMEQQFSEYRLSESLMTMYKLFWDEFSSWYLEIVKPAYRKPIDKKTYESTIEFLEKLLKLLHPFMPFITEEIWHLLRSRSTGDFIAVASMPAGAGYDKKMLERFEKTKETVSAIRTVRKENNIPLKEPISLNVMEKEEVYDNRFGEILKKLCYLSDINFISEKMDGAVTFIVKTTEFYIPLGDKMNVEEELSRLQAELSYTRGFLSMVMNKLKNERFIKNAPEHVVQSEMKKKSDAETKIKVLEERIAHLK